MPEYQCFKVTCQTTHAVGATIKVGDSTYIDCERGVVYMVAKSAVEVLEAFKHAPLLGIERIGVAYVPKESTQ